MAWHRALSRIAAALILAFALAPGAARAADVLVFAAASLKTALDDVAAAFEAQTGSEVAVAYAGSSALARQILAGAPADIFISANTLWMDEVEAAGLLAKGSRRDLLGNRLVLVGPADLSAVSPADLSAEALAARLGDGRLAMALVDAVPAGMYGKSALASLGLWEALAPRIAQADNVRAALALVARGEAPLGIVYATDAAAEPRVSVLATFPEESHPPIVYPVARLADAGEPAAAFLDYLAGPDARARFEREGFAVLTP